MIERDVEYMAEQVGTGEHRQVVTVLVVRDATLWYAGSLGEFDLAPSVLTPGVSESSTDEVEVSDGRDEKCNRAVLQ